MGFLYHWVDVQCILSTACVLYDLVLNFFLPWMCVQWYVLALLIDTLEHTGKERLWISISIRACWVFFFFFHFFFWGVMNDTMEGRFPFCHNKNATNFCVDGLMLEGGSGLWSSVTTEAKQRQAKATGARLLCHSYQYEQPLTTEAAHGVTSSWTFLT